MATAKVKQRPPVVDQLRHEAGSSDPLIAEQARDALAALGRKGGKAAAKRRKARKEKSERQLSLDIEAYRRASRGW